MDFNRAATMAADQIERPPNMPIGTYLWQVTKVPTQEEIANGAYEVCDFQCKCLGPATNNEGDTDIDPDDLQKYGKVAGVPQRIRFMFDKNDDTRFAKSLFNLKQFLLNTLKCWSEDGSPLKQGLNGSVNCKFLGTIRRRPDRENPEVMYDEIGKYAPVE